MDIEERITVEPPKNVSLSVVEDGKVKLTWIAPTMDVDYYIVYKNGIVHNQYPYIVPRFEFPFSNESLTSSLIQISWYQRGRSLTLSAAPGVTNRFEVSCVKDGVESARIGKTIVYTKKMVFEKVLITPNPCEVQDDITVEVKVKEEFETTIT